MDTRVVYSKELSEKVTGAFVGKVDSQPVSSTYKLGLLVVACMMMLIPLIYVGLIGGIVYGMVWWGSMLSNASGSLSSVRGRGSVFVLLMAVAPIIIGVILVVFLIKALFKPWGRKPPIRKIFRNNEPMLFAFVDKICETVGAPKPAEIHVDCHVNASASFLNGWRGIFTNNLVLTIGLPLVNGLSLRELGGVIAHEMGHFRQPLAMRLTYAIWTLNDYLEHLSTDDSVENSVDTAHSASRAGAAGCVIYFLTVLFIFFTRMIMYALMKLAQALSCYMMRQMEYDADRCEAALVGSDAFESAMRKVPVLAAAELMSYKDISHALGDGRLADDLPALISTNIARLSPAEKNKIQNEQTRPTGTFDTHPSDRDRIMAVRNLRYPPKFLVELPASVVLKNFETLSRTATIDMYLQVLGHKFRPEMLKKSEKVAEAVRSDLTGEEVMGRFFQSILPPYRPLPIQETVLKAGPPSAELIEKLRKIRLEAFQRAPLYRKNLKAYLQADIDTYNAGLACHLLSSGFVIPPKVLTRDMGLSEGTMACAQRVRDETGAIKENLKSKLQPFETDAATRLVDALRLWYTPDFTQKWDPQSERAKEIGDLLPVLHYLADLMPEVQLLEQWHLAMVNTYNSLPEGVNPRTKALAEVAAAHAQNMAAAGTKIYGTQHAKLLEVAESMWDATYDQLAIVYEKLGDVLYPFDHKRGQVTFRQLLIPTMPGKDALFKVDQVTSETVGKLYETYDRALCRLCVLADEAEKNAGLMPMNVVKREDCLPIKKEPEFKVI